MRRLPSQPSNKQLGGEVERHDYTMRKVIMATLLLAGLSVAATKAAFWFASLPAIEPLSKQDCAVLVLGYPTKKDGNFSPIERFRVEAGVQVYQKHQCSKLILSGAAVKNEHVEADSMAELAKKLGVPTKNMVLERNARSTWENVGCTAPLAASVDRILVVSDALHAKRAARYACRQDPRLCERFLGAGIAPSSDLAFFWSIPAAANELRIFFRDLLLYRSGATENAPRCLSEEASSANARRISSGETPRNIYETETALK